MGIQVGLGIRHLIRPRSPHQVHGTVLNETTDGSESEVQPSHRPFGPQFEAPESALRMMDPAVLEYMNRVHFDKENQDPNCPVQFRQRRGNLAHRLF